MQENKKISELKTKNSKIINFYERYPNMDFETINIIIIELYEKMIDTVTGSSNESITNQILFNIKQMMQENEIFKSNQNLTATNLHNEIHDIKDIIYRLNTDISSNIITRIFEVKQSYTDDLKMILNNSQYDNITKLANIIEKENQTIINKTTTIINDLLPKSYNEIHIKYDNIIFDFKQDMTKNIENLKLSNSSLSIEKISDLLENKYTNLMNNIQQSLLTFISSTEERLTSNLNEVKTLSVINQTTQNKINTDLEEYLNKYKNSSKKGEIGEIKLELLLNKIFTNSEIIRTSGKTSSGDFIVKRDNKQTIMFENKDYTYQVDKSEISKFINDIEKVKCHGIFLSQYSTITNKKNYQIEYHKGFILIYLSFVEYNPDMISVAVDIIDHLSLKLSLVEHSNVITDELLDHINNEYSTFITKKNILISHLKDSTKKSIDLLTEIELSTLGNYLSTKFACAKLNDLLCDNCGIFIGKNRKSLSSHKKSCLLKINNNTNTLSDVSN